MSYAVLVATVPAIDDVAVTTASVASTPASARTQAVRDTTTGEVASWAVYDRAALSAGATMRGPAIIAEDETSTLVCPGWNASVNAWGYIELLRESA